MADVRVPEDATAGDYTGSVVVSDQDRERRRLSRHPHGRRLLHPPPRPGQLVPDQLLSRVICSHGRLRSHGTVDQRWQLDKLYAEAGLNNRIIIPNPFPGSYGDSGAQTAPTSASARAHFDQDILPLINGTDPNVQLPGGETHVPAAVWLLRAFWLRTVSATGSSWQRKDGFGDLVNLILCDEPYADQSLWASECKPNAGPRGSDLAGSAQARHHQRRRSQREFGHHRRRHDRAGDQ